MSTSTRFELIALAAWSAAALACTSASPAATPVTPDERDATAATAAASTDDACEAAGRRTAEEAVNDRLGLDAARLEALERAVVEACREDGWPTEVARCIAETTDTAHPCLEQLTEAQRQGLGERVGTIFAPGAGDHDGERDDAEGGTGARRDDGVDPCEGGE